MHSSTTREHGYAFDTLHGTRASLLPLDAPGRPDASRLYDILTTSHGVMPPDAPLETAAC